MQRGERPSAHSQGRGEAIARIAHAAHVTHTGAWTGAPGGAARLKAFPRATHLRARPGRQDDRSERKIRHDTRGNPSAHGFDSIVLIMVSVLLLAVFAAFRLVCDCAIPRSAF